MKKQWKIILIVSGLLLIASGSYFYYYHFIPKRPVVEIPESDTLLTEKEVIRLYGIPVDSFEIVDDVVKRNQMLLSILSHYSLPEGSVAGLISQEHDAFDLRKIRAGNKFVVFLEKDSLRILRYLVYEHTPIEYVRFAFGDSTVSVDIGYKEVRQERKFAQGKIHTSLWNAMIDHDINPTLANELSEIYAWSIDFFGLQPADSFSVVYDEQFVDSVSVGLGRIHAAYFRHTGTDFYAIPFVQDSVESYYDLEGQSLRKAFLKAPLHFSRISSRFSHSRLHPILKIRRPHHGVDYAAPSGTPVVAIGDGKIIKAKRGYNRGAGNMIKIRHNGVYTTAYLHLSGFAPGIKYGVYVKQGDVIGYVGSTGLSTGPHLDFRFYKNGNPVDPLKVEAPPVEPVHEENFSAFDSVKMATIKLLHQAGT
ncbi:MAG: peptidoglycan DD-metalloendopeptidase family protein [Bacteroidales bacterium]|jgi:murein DD-endopeptidase MepM/ murein hydrolase activator NlpD